VRYGSDDGLDRAPPADGPVSARNKITKLPHGTSLFDLRAALPTATDRSEKDGLRLFSPESALIECSP